jgi:hypothetical protein
MPQGFDPNYNFDLERWRVASGLRHTGSTITPPVPATIPDQLHAVGGITINETTALATATDWQRVHLGTAIALKQPARVHDNTWSQWTIELGPGKYSTNTYLGPDPYCRDESVFRVVDVAEVWRYEDVVRNTWGEM